MDAVGFLAGLLHPSVMQVSITQRCLAAPVPNWDYVKRGAAVGDNQRHNPEWRRCANKPPPYLYRLEQSIAENPGGILQWLPCRFAWKQVGISLCYR